MGKYELMRALAANETYRQAFERFGIGEERTCCSDDQGVTAIERVDSCCCTPQPDQTGKGSPTFSVASAQPLRGNEFSQLAGQSPSQTLAIATKLFRRGFSPARANFLEAAINRLGASMALDSKSNQLITEAIQAIRDGSPKTPPETGGGADHIFCTLFKHADFNPPFLFVSHLNWQTYKQVRADTLRASGMHDAVSSLKLVCGPTPEVAGEAILFEHDRFVGRYSRFQIGQSRERDESYVGDFINDKTSSILVVRHWDNEIPVSVGDNVDVASILNFIRKQKNVSGTRGSPIFTWDMFPDGRDFHPNDPASVLIYVRVPISVDPSSFLGVPYWDVDAEIRYWIGLSIDPAGNLIGSVRFFSAWVDGDLLADEILDRLMKRRIPATLDFVNGEVGKALRQANDRFAPFESFYLLPGRGGGDGTTDEGVTVVLVRLIPQPWDDVPIL
jgi:hypothetical protein